MEKELKAFNQILRELMNENHLNISQLAEKINIPRTSINNWLNQKRSPNIESLVIIAKFFNCSVDYLLGIEDIFGNKI